MSKIPGIAGIAIRNAPGPISKLAPSNRKKKRKRKREKAERNLPLTPQGRNILAQRAVAAGEISRPGEFGLLRAIERAPNRRTILGR